MDDRTLLRTVLVVAVLSLAVNAYALYEVRGRATAQEAAPANMVTLGSDCEVGCALGCRGNADKAQCHRGCVCRCNGPGFSECVPLCYEPDNLDQQCLEECQERLCGPA